MVVPAGTFVPSPGRRKPRAGGEQELLKELGGGGGAHKGQWQPFQPGVTPSTLQ